MIYTKLYNDVNVTRAVMVVAHDLLEYRVFSLTWPTSMQIYWNKRKRLHKKRVQLPEDWFGTPTWPPFHCFGTQIWPLWRHVKTHNRYMDDVTENLLFCFVQSSARSWKWLWDYFGLRQVKASKSKTCKVTGRTSSPAWKLWKPFSYCSIEENQPFSLGRTLSGILQFKIWTMI